MKKSFKKFIERFTKNGFIRRFKNVTFEFKLCYDLHNL